MSAIELEGNQGEYRPAPSKYTIEYHEGYLSATFPDGDGIVVKGLGIMSLYEIFDRLRSEIGSRPVLEQIAKGAGFEVFTFASAGKSAA